MLLAQPAWTAEPDSGVTKASYTTGKNGQQLKWLPIRAADARTVKQAVAIQELPTPSGSPSARPLLAAPADAFGDPFEDSKKKGGSAPAGKLSRTLAQESPAKGSPDAAAPGTSPVEKKPLLSAPETEAPKAKPSDELAADTKATCPASRKWLNRAGAEVTEDEHYKELLLEWLPPRKEKPEDQFPLVCKTEAQRPYDDRRTWGRTPFLWKASALGHKPAYFEDEALERYGHTWGPWFQPWVSGGHFFLTLPALPYIMGLYPPHECIYTLGYYRPGNCAPYMFDPLPLSIRAALLEGGVWTGMVFLIP